MKERGRGVDSSRRRMWLPICCADRPAKGGLHWNEPWRGKLSKKLPREPNHRSVSRNAEKKLASRRRGVKVSIPVHE